MEDYSNVTRDFVCTGGSIGQKRREIEKINREKFRGERSLYRGRQLDISDCVFCDGESPLKECEDLALSGCLFQWKYPLWNCSNVSVKQSVLYEMARAGIWYTKDLTMTDTVIDAPKTFRRCDGLLLEHVTMSHAEETLWSCKNVTMNQVTAKGAYFAMNSENVKVDGLTLSGDYSFDGCKNVEVRNSKLISKDAFWNTENVTVYDSFISGEYLAWNSKNIRFVNCTIESLQGLCYIENLVMENCELIDTTLAFEYSSVDAQIKGDIESVLNPKSGTIRANQIKELILESDKIDPTKTKIICEAGM